MAKDRWEKEYTLWYSTVHEPWIASQKEAARILAENKKDAESIEPEWLQQQNKNQSNTAMNIWLIVAIVFGAFMVLTGACGHIMQN